MSRWAKRFSQRVIGALGNWLIAMFFPLDIRFDLPYNIDILKCINMTGSGGNG
jgi:hypothetical protein